MLNQERAVLRLGKIRDNLNESIRIMQRLDKDLQALQQDLTPTLADIQEREYELEDRIDVIKQAQRLWGDKK